MENNIEDIRERLQHEIMEDYIRCAEHRYQAKDPVAHMEEMRRHFDRLLDFITQTHNNALRLAVESLGSLHSNEVWGEETIKVLYEITNSWIKNVKELEIYETLR